MSDPTHKHTDTPSPRREQAQHDEHSHEHSGTCSHSKPHAHHEHDHEHDHEHGNENEHEHHAHSHDDDHNHDHHGHGHGHHHHDHGPGHHHHHGPNNKAGLLIAFSITTGIMLLEFFGGLATDSLALLSDAGHMLSDAGALLLSLVAMWFAAKPASPNKSFGFYRFEILAALLNGAALFVIAAIIVWEAFQRLFAPPEVQSGTMILIAAIGLFANLISAWFLMRKGDVKDNINVRSAYLHILGDALGSVGAIAAGVLMYAFGWYTADPIISVVVALLILKSAWGVIRWAIHILMEGTPIAIDGAKVSETLLAIPGVLNVHDLHVWTITSGRDSLTCHLLVEQDADAQAILRQAIERIEAVFKIKHSTIQIETTNFHDVQCSLSH